MSSGETGFRQGSGNLKTPGIFVRRKVNPVDLSPTSTRCDSVDGLLPACLLHRATSFPSFLQRPVCNTAAFSPECPATLTRLEIKKYPSPTNHFGLDAYMHWLVLFPPSVEGCDTKQEKNLFDKKSKARF